VGDAGQLAAARGGGMSRAAMSLTPLSLIGCPTQFRTGWGVL